MISELRTARNLSMEDVEEMGTTLIPSLTASGNAIRVLVIFQVRQ